MENMSCFCFGEPVAASHATLCPAILAPDMGEVSVEFCQGSVFIICCGFFNKWLPVVHQTCFSSNSLCVCVCVCVCVHACVHACVCACRQERKEKKRITVIFIMKCESYWFSSNEFLEKLPFLNHEWWYLLLVLPQLHRLYQQKKAVALFAFVMLMSTLLYRIDGPHQWVSGSHIVTLLHHCPLSCWCPLCCTTLMVHTSR